MAHTTDGKGPYPDKAGEYCGNHFPGSEPALGVGQSPQVAKRHQEEWLARMRFGKPANCGAGTSEEMAQKGWVGLYLKEDRELYEWETPIDTNELHEDQVSRLGRPERTASGALGGAPEKSPDTPPHSE